MESGGFILNNTYYLMRHGESEANAAGIIISDPAVGVERYGLTGAGRVEARESAVKFRESHGLDVIYSSDFRRALETALIAADVCGVGRVRPSPLLRERYFGEFEGSGSDNYGMIWELDMYDPDNRACGVESPRDVGNRAIDFLSACEEEHAGESILLVAHGDVLQILYCAANGIPVRLHRSIDPFRKAEIRSLLGQARQKKEL